MSAKHNAKVAPSGRKRNMHSVHNGVAGYQSWTVIMGDEEGIGMGRVIEDLRVVRPVAVNQRT